jgi:hypothetical protein
MKLEDYKDLNEYLNCEYELTWYDDNAIKALEGLAKDTSDLNPKIKYQLKNLLTDNLVATSFTILGLLIGLLGIIQIL